MSPADEKLFEEAAMLEAELEARRKLNARKRIRENDHHLFNMYTTTATASGSSEKAPYNMQTQSKAGKPNLKAVSTPYVDDSNDGTSDGTDSDGWETPLLQLPGTCTKKRRSG